ncbi:UDP-N-acetylmuramoyl-L-alanine--D-glutamate ligase [Candidatus Falkowbacteria bacterium]|nr:UDP-N-acetylmuramoyl-L-alanine--D-glutamate ligase [Candidatus Falkowbacteria bacterium]
MDFKNKKVTVMGLGLHSGGVATVLWLVKHGAQVTVTDLKTKKELEPSLKKLFIKRSSDQAIKLVLGHHREIDFKKADLVIQNPGVPKQSKYLILAKKLNIPIENEASLFFKNCPAKIIGVTGTRGKSTTASLIYELLRRRDVDVLPAAKAWLAGLPQKPMLGVLDKIKSKDAVVLELSSWQLEVLSAHKLSPNIAVMTNIYPDHLNRHAGMPAYIEAKKNIFSFQTQSDFVVLNYDNQETKKIGQEVRSRRFWFSQKYFPEENGCFVKKNKIIFRRDGAENVLADIKDIKLKGDHNLENVLAALTVTGISDLSNSKIKSALKKFSGLPGRMELIKEIKGVKYINDTASTIPEAAISALNALGTPRLGPRAKNIVLIAGGSSKNIPDAGYYRLAELIKQKVKAVILFSGQGSDQVLKQLKEIKYQAIVSEISKMSDAIGIAQSYAKKGDIILLSPACASFGLFSNEFDRGDQFRQVIGKL